MRETVHEIDACWICDTMTLRAVELLTWWIGDIMTVRYARADHMLYVEQHRLIILLQ